MKNDSFHRTYPISGTMVFLLVTLLPLVLALYSCIYSVGQFGLGALEYVITERSMLMAMAVSLILAITSTVLAIGLGMVGARIMANYSFAGKRFYEGLFRLPFYLPTIIFAFGYLVFLGSAGLVPGPLAALARLAGPVVEPYLPLVAMAAVLCIYYTPMVISIVGDTWSKLDYRVEQTALTLGTSKRTVYRTITKPRLKTSIRKAAALVFLNSLTSLSVVLILTGNSDIYNMQAIILGYHNNIAAALAVISVTVGLVALSVYTANDSSRSQESADVRTAWIPIRPKGLVKCLGIFLYTLLSVVLILGPILVVLARAVLSLQFQFSFECFMKLFGDVSASGLRSLVFSIALALFSAAISCGAATRICSRNLRDSNSNQGIFLLELAIGPVVIAYGLYELRALVQSLTGFEIPALVLVAVAHIAITIPICMLLILPACRTLPAKLADNSRTLGYSPRETFRMVEKPILKPAIRAGFCTAFAFSLGDLGVALLLGGTETKTMSVQVYRMILNGDIQGACALGSVLFAICFVMFLVARRQQRKCHV